MSQSWYPIRIDINRDIFWLSLYIGVIIKYVNSEIMMARPRHASVTQAIFRLCSNHFMRRGLQLITEPGVSSSTNQKQGLANLTNQKPHLIWSLTNRLLKVNVRVSDWELNLCWNDERCKCNFLEFLKQISIIIFTISTKDIWPNKIKLKNENDLNVLL